MGHEMAGEVVEVVPIHNTGEDIYGNNENNLYADPNIFKVGDRVTGSPIFGGFAEYVVVDYDAAHKIPDGVTYEPVSYTHLISRRMTIWSAVSSSIWSRRAESCTARSKG